MFEKVKDISKKMKIAKDLILNGSKLIPLVKTKAEELFKFKLQIPMQNKKGSIVMNGKFECTSVTIDKEEFLKDPKGFEEELQKKITILNQKMLEHILEEAKGVGKEVDPSLMDKISNEIEDEIKK
jgi:DNA-binding protein YbaB